MQIFLFRDDRIAFAPTATAGRPASAARYSVSKPINDLLGLRDDEQYAAWLESQWGDLAPDRSSIATMLGEPNADKPEAGLRDDLARIAAEASQRGGRIDYRRLADLLSEVRYFPATAATDESPALPAYIETPSLAVLAVWALAERQVQRPTPDNLVFCPTCLRPWFTRWTLRDAIVDQLRGETSLNCPRPAPGLTMTCAELHTHDRFARERGEWAKEYAKVLARKRRGKSVTEADFRAWKAENKAGERGKDWIPFDEWRAQRAAEEATDGDSH